MSAGECLFSGVVPMFVRTGTAGWVPGWPPVQPAGQYSPSATPYEQCRRCDSISVEISLTPLINGKRALDVRLVDAGDPFFMWQLSMGEEDFFVLKREQSLLIDFSRFPYKLIELLQACVTHAREEQPIYTAWLNVSHGGEGKPLDCLLTVTEATTFRQVPHLSLRFGAVNEATMRKHLAEMFRQYRGEVDGLKSRLSGSSGFQHQPFSAGLSSMPNDYQSLREYCRMLEERLLGSTAGHAGAGGSAPTAGSAGYGVPAGGAAGRRPASLSAMEAQLVGLETLVKEKTGEIMRLNEIVQAMRDQRHQWDESTSKLRDELAQRDAALATTKEEIAKANDIIRKLQDEIKTCRARLRSAEAFNRQHEKLVRDSHTTYETVKQELADLRVQLAAKGAELAEAGTLRKQLEAEIVELKEKNQANEYIIDYYHRGGSEARPGDLTFSPEYWGTQGDALRAAMMGQAGVPPGEETSY